jgi:tetratricopeptide (TPR) repeat protein
LEIAGMELGRKNYAAAAEQCRRVLDRKPEMVRARIVLADALEQTGDKRGALAQHREILKLSPNSGLSQVAVAADEAGVGKLDSAEKLYLSGLANALVEQQRLADNIVRELQSSGGSLDFQRLLAIASGNKKYDDTISSGLAGLFLLVSRRPARESAVVAALDDLGRRFPRSRSVADRLLGYYRSHGANQKVEALYKRSLEASPKDAGLWADYGKFLESEGRRAEALKAYREAAEIDPKNETAAARAKELEDKP